MDSFLEDLYIASNELFSEMMRQGDTLSPKMENTLYKYWSRACTRSTPFGLFSCCSIGKVGGEETRIVVSPPDGIVRTTKLDMNYVCSLVQYLETLPIIKSQLRFFPNDSVYKVGDRIRYVEYYYVKTRRIHQIQEIDASPEILSVLDAAREGKTIEQLSLLLVSPDVSYSDAEEFVNELVSNQILKSEMEVNVTGEDSLSRSIEIIRGMKDTAAIVASLTRIESGLESIDKELVHKQDNYERLREELETFPVEYEDKFLLQTNVFRPCQIGRMSQAVISDIQAALVFLQKFHNNDGQTPLKSFFSAFIDRYEHEAVPLLEVLDGDIGLGYPLDAPRIIDNPLLKGCPIGTAGGRKKQDVSFSAEELLVLRKYTEQSEKGFPEEIVLDDNDVKDQEGANNSEYFETLSVMGQIMGDGIYLKSVGGATAASLLGRFFFLDPEIESLIKQICLKEQDALPGDTVAAEIVHLPESRIGNISSRPCSREVEVHYLARSGATSEKSVPVSDLMIQNIEGRVVLFSKSLQKKIRPVLSNAHNYRFGIPVYRFLCDYQYAYKKSIFSLQLDNLFAAMRYLPRIRYKNVYLQMRSWFLDTETVFGAGVKDPEKARVNVMKWRKDHSIPDTVIIKEADNTLFLDLNRDVCVDILIEKIRKGGAVIIEETMPPANSGFTVTDGENSYCAEFIVPFYKTV